MNKALLGVSTAVFLVAGCVTVGPSASGTPAGATSGPPSIGAATTAPLSFPPIPTLPVVSLPPVATPTVVPTPTLAPPPTATPLPTLGGTTEPTTPASSEPTPAGSPSTSTRDLLFSDDMSDPTSGWSPLDQDFASVSYDTGVLAFRFNSNPAWALSPRQLAGPETTLVAIGDYLPESDGFFGSLCGDSGTGNYYGAVVGTDGSLVFISISNATVTVLGRHDKLGLSAPVDTTTPVAMECSTTTDGEVSIIVGLADTGPVALLVDDGGGLQNFDSVALYGEAASDGYTLAVDAAAVYGVGGSDGTMSDGAQKLLSHIPTDFQKNCFESPPFNDAATYSSDSPLFNDAATYSVTCIPQTGGTGAEIEGYKEYANKDDMDAEYQDLIDSFGVESTGTCQTGPNETNWTISGTTFGRVQCAPQKAGIRFDWTDDTTSILSELIDFGSSYADTYAQWINAGPV